MITLQDYYLPVIRITTDSSYSARPVTTDGILWLSYLLTRMSHGQVVDLGSIMLTNDPTINNSTLSTYYIYICLALELTIRAINESLESTIQHHYYIL